MGPHIKIGYTANIRSRMGQYVTGKLLAVEPGGATLETQRHRQFAGSRSAGREWFAPTPELMELIAAIRATHRIPESVPKRFLKTA